MALGRRLCRGGSNCERHANTSSDSDWSNTSDEEDEPTAPSARAEIHYTPEELAAISQQRESILSTLQRDKFKIYPNQTEQAKSIVAGLRDRALVNLMVVGRTQAGKTGTMLGTVKEYITNFNIPVEHIYIITGLSSKG